MLRNFFQFDMFNQPYMRLLPYHTLICSWYKWRCFEYINFSKNKPCFNRLRYVVNDVVVWDKHLFHGWCETTAVSADQGPVSLRLMTSQFKDIVTHTQKWKTVKCLFCGVWVQNFVRKFQRCPLKFHTKFWTHTLQNVNFTRRLKFDDLWYLRVMTS